jgi:hypothetical protein
MMSLMLMVVAKKNYLNGFLCVLSFKDILLDRVEEWLEEERFPGCGKKE